MNRARLFLDSAFTLDYFCHTFMCARGNYDFKSGTYGFDYRTLNVSSLSLSFIEHFELKHPLEFQELLTICDNSGIALNLFPNTQKARGYNFSYGEDVLIYLKEGDSPTGHIHTLLHELFEIIDQILSSCSKNGYERQKKDLENKADQFSSLVHVPDEIVLNLLNSNGLDVFRLKKLSRCSYATALIRMNEVLCNLMDSRAALPAPVIGILYERQYWNDTPSGMIPCLQLNSYVKSKGFPFALRRNELEDLLFFAWETGPMTISELRNTYADVGNDLLLMNLEMLFKASRLTVDVLIRPVIWRNFEHAAKILIQLIPSKHDSLRDLADRLNIMQYDLS